ncbi:FlgD immunoglobulin-like domain containing protein, partial [Candidatus Eisenbacteria bacterium]
RPNNPDCRDVTECECAGHAYYRFRSQVVFYRDPLSAVENERKRGKEDKLRLVGSFPNPSSPRHTIEYALSEPGEVTISLYDAQGAQVHSVSQHHAFAGPCSWSWDGTNSDGHRVTAGVYVCEVRYQRQRVSTKVLIVK